MLEVLRLLKGFMHSKDLNGHGFFQQYFFICFFTSVFDVLLFNARAEALLGNTDWQLYFLRLVAG